MQDSTIYLANMLQQITMQQETLQKNLQNTINE